MILKTYHILDCAVLKKIFHIWTYTKLCGHKIVQRPKSKEIKINNMSSVYISTIPYIIIPYLIFLKIILKMFQRKTGPPPPHVAPPYALLWPWSWQIWINTLRGYLIKCIDLILFIFLCKNLPFPLILFRPTSEIIILTNLNLHYLRCFHLSYSGSLHSF